VNKPLDEDNDSISYKLKKKTTQNKIKATAFFINILIKWFLECVSKTKINDRCISKKREKRKRERERERERKKYSFLNSVKINLPYKILGRIICSKIY